MRRSAYKDYQESGDVELNMSPLIDVVFLLLIFFVTTSSFVEDVGIEVSRPGSVTAHRVATEALRLGIAANGQVYFGGEPISVNQIRRVIAPGLAQGSQDVILLADREVSAGILVAVIDECKLSGAQHVHVAVDQPDGGS